MTDHSCWQDAINGIRASLRARLEDRVEGADKEIMELVDEIVRKEAYLHVHDDFSLHCLCGMCAEARIDDDWRD